MSIHPTSPQPNGWLNKLLQSPAIGKTLDEIGGRLMDYIDDHYGIDLDPDAGPIVIHKPSQEALSPEDLYLFGDDGKRTDDNALLCTQRLYKLLNQWGMQQLPRLMKEDSGVVLDTDQINELEAGIHQAIGDYITLGIIKGHAKPTFAGVKTLLENAWQHSLGKPAIDTPSTPPRN